LVSLGLPPSLLTTASGASVALRLGFDLREGMVRSSAE
jgi:hypothetical protein